MAVKLARQSGGRHQQAAAAAAPSTDRVTRDIPHIVGQYAEPQTDGDETADEDDDNDVVMTSRRSKLKQILSLLEVTPKDHDMKRVQFALKQSECQSTTAQQNEWSRLRRVVLIAVRGICSLACPFDADALFEDVCCSGSTAAVPKPGAQESDELLERLATAIVRFPRSSDSRRAVLAVAGGVSEPRLRIACQIAAAEAGQPDAQLFSKERLAQARRDFGLLRGGHAWPALSIRRMRCKDDDILEAVRFVLHPDHVLRTAWPIRYGRCLGFSENALRTHWRTRMSIYVPSTGGRATLLAGRLT